MEKPTVVVLFGATGDLARRKLLPGLLQLEQVSVLPRSQLLHLLLSLVFLSFHYYL